MVEKSNMQENSEKQLSPRDAIVILGILIDSLKMEDAIQKILAIINTIHKSRTPHYISTVNMDFLTHVHHWNPPDIRYPELMRLLRESAIATADGMSIVWLSKWLGVPLPARISGADLFEQLVREFHYQHKSMFFVGGEEDVVSLAVSSLHIRFPDFKIAGIATPPINTLGEKLENADMIDSFLIEQINQASPDLLILSLGNPKQEIWFERIRHQLHIPLAIGIGGALKFISGAIPRAPKWMQHMGLEWLHRFLYEPKRLGKRYFLGGIKFFYMTVPLIVYHHFNRFIWKKRQVKSSVTSYFFLASFGPSISVIRIPAFVGTLETQQLFEEFQKALNQEYIILDFSDAHHMNLEGLSFLLQACQQAKQFNIKLCCLHLHFSMRLLLKLHRLWDLIKIRLYESVEIFISHLNLKETGPYLWETIKQNDQQMTIGFFGELNDRVSYEEYLQNLQPMLQGKNCLIDLTYCTQLDNSAITFLLHIKKTQTKQEKKLQIRGIQKSILEDLKVAKVSHFFDYIE